MRTCCVIGAGPSGLVAAKLLREHGYDALIYEAGGEIGGTFANKTYEGGRLVSSRFLTPFSDLRMDDLPASENHPTVPAYLAYLRAYCDKFSLWPLINFGHRVEHVRALGGDADGYAVRVVDADGRQSERTFDIVAVCSGLHNVPRLPAIPGVESFRGEVFHSSAYKAKAQLAGRRVVVVGTGETAMDVVYHACLVGKAVTLSVRRGFLSVPHEGWGGVPLDSESRPRCAVAAACWAMGRAREEARERNVWRLAGPCVHAALTIAPATSPPLRRLSAIITNAFEHSHEHPLVTKYRLKWKARAAAHTKRSANAPAARAALERRSCKDVPSPPEPASPSLTRGCAALPRRPAARR